MKASWRHLSSSSSRRLDQDEYIGLSYMSSEDVFIKTNTFVLAIPLQDTFKTFSRRFQDVLPRRLKNVFNASCKNVFKISSRRLQNVLQRCLQDVLKTYHQVVNCLPRSRIYLDHFWEIYGQCRKFASAIRFSIFVFVFVFNIYLPSVTIYKGSSFQRRLI